MASSVEKIVENFPYPTLTPITGVPDFETLSELHTQANSNSSSVQSNLGGGHHGLLALTLEPAVLNPLTGVVFVTPVNPGQSATVPAGSTAAQISALRKDFDYATLAFKEWVNTDKALKSQLVEAIEGMYLKALRNKYVGFTNQTFLSMMAHLYLHYAKITPNDLLLNDKAMKTPYDPNLPIENLFEQITDAVEFASAGKTPYTPLQIENTAYQIIFNTGVFSLDCKEWRKKPAVDKTWPNFQTFWTEKHMDYREEQTQMTGQGYQANNVTHSNQETIDAIACLATATAHDRAAMENLTATNLVLAQELKSAQDALVVALQKITKLTESVQYWKSQKGTSGGTGPPTSTEGRTYYCHSCGCDCPHHSGNCPSPKPGHNKHATVLKKHGGNESNYKK